MVKPRSARKITTYITAAQMTDVSRLIGSEGFSKNKNMATINELQALFVMNVLFKSNFNCLSE